MAVSRVLHVIPSVGPLRGGPSETIRTITAGLARQGVDTHVVTTDDNGPGRLAVTCGIPVDQEGVTYWYFPRQTTFYTCSWPLNAWLARHVSDFDVVHIHALFSFATVPAAYWSNRRGVPYVVRPLGTLNRWGMTNRRRWLKAMSFRYIERQVLEHAARIHYTTHQERLEAESLGISVPAAIIPNALREEQRPAQASFRAGHSELQGRRLVLFLSRVDAVKGLELLLEAFVHVRALIPDACLVVAGDGEPAFIAALKERASMLGLDSHIVWVGFLTADAKRAALAEADVFVLPSYSESFGMAAAEAMSAGVPVVVSDRVGIHSEIAAAGAGIVVRCDAGDIGTALVRLLQDGALRGSMSTHGRTLSRELYSPDAVTTKLIEMYTAVVDAAATARPVRRGAAYTGSDARPHATER